MILTEFFPEALTRLPVWVLWRLEERKGHMTKVPYSVTGKRADTTDPTTWADYSSALRLLTLYPHQYNGIGCVMAKDYSLVFIDVDHCIQDGNFDERAEDILEAFSDDAGNVQTFAEVSQSGTGLHIFVIGNIPVCFNNRTKGVEMYDDKHFCAMTGRAYSAREPVRCDIGLQYCYERYRTRKTGNTGMLRPVDPSTQKDDDWVIRHAEQNGHKFASLFSGDLSGYESRSEADIALCKLLAFWTNGDPEQIDRIFRRSGLYRAKWERDNYRIPTIRNAIDANTGAIADYTRRKREEEGREMIDALGRMYHQGNRCSGSSEGT